MGESGWSWSGVRPVGLCTDEPQGANDGAGGRRPRVAPSLAVFFQVAKLAGRPGFLFLLSIPPRHHAPSRRSPTEKGYRERKTGKDGSILDAY